LGAVQGYVVFEVAKLKWTECRGKNVGNTKQLVENEKERERQNNRQAKEATRV
jgi:hypothetical protein